MYELLYFFFCMDILSLITTPAIDIKQFQGIKMGKRVPTYPTSSSQMTFYSSSKPLTHRFRDFVRFQGKCWTSKSLLWCLVQISSNQTIGRNAKIFLEFLLKIRLGGILELQLTSRDRKFTTLLLYLTKYPVKFPDKITKRQNFVPDGLQMIPGSILPKLVIVLFFKNSKKKIIAWQLQHIWFSSI